MCYEKGSAMRVIFLFVLLLEIPCSTMLQAAFLEQNAPNLVADNPKEKVPLRHDCPQCLLKKIHDHNMIFDDYSLGTTLYEEEGKK
jgi:hypothetical protein